MKPWPYFARLKPKCRTSFHSHQSTRHGADQPRPHACHSHTARKWHEWFHGHWLWGCHSKLDSWWFRFGITVTSGFAQHSINDSNLCTPLESVPSLYLKFFNLPRFEFTHHSKPKLILNLLMWEYVTPDSLILTIPSLPFPPMHLVSKIIVPPRYVATSTHATHLLKLRGDGRTNNIMFVFSERLNSSARLQRRSGRTSRTSSTRQYYI